MKYYIFIGTTAEFIKVAPIIKQLQKNGLPYKIITSGQGKIRFDEFSFYLKIRNPIISLTYKGDKSSLIKFFLWAIRALITGLYILRKEFIHKDRSNMFFMVHGDTVSSLLGAIIAKIYGLRLVHIESGLRSFNFFEPFPEEISRFIISHLADIHFCPNLWSVNNLSTNHGSKFNTRQNTLIDIFKNAFSILPKRISHIKLPKKYFVLVIHRQEHVIFQRQFSQQLLDLILNHSRGLTCVLVMHQLTKEFLSSLGSGINQKLLKNVKLVPRLPYLEFTTLLKDSEYLITDGGSNQEEAFYLGIPCLLLRKHTERIEGLGMNIILSKMDHQIITNFINHYQKYRRNQTLSSDKPSQLIVEYLEAL